MQKHFFQECESCQRFANITRKPSADLINITCSVPFVEWGIDLIGLVPEGRENCRYVVVAIDYFTKGMEVEPLASITERKIKKFHLEEHHFQIR